MLYTSQPFKDVGIILFLNHELWECSLSLPWEILSIDTEILHLNTKFFSCGIWNEFDSWDKSDMAITAYFDQSLAYHHPVPSIFQTVHTNLIVVVILCFQR